MYYAFPALGTLAGKTVEAALRGLGFGYRAGYVHRSAQMIMEELGGEAWLLSLRTAPYGAAWNELQRLPGVGPKVADCVCLMGLDKLEAVPVDTHVLRIVERDYGLKREGKGTSADYYRRVGEMFNLVFGKTAGWAQAVSGFVVCACDERMHAWDPYACISSTIYIHQNCITHAHSPVHIHTPNPCTPITTYIYIYTTPSI